MYVMHTLNASYKIIVCFVYLKQVMVMMAIAQHYNVVRRNITMQ